MQVIMPMIVRAAAFQNVHLTLGRVQHGPVVGTPLWWRGRSHWEKFLPQIGRTNVAMEVVQVIITGINASEYAHLVLVSVPDSGVSCSDSWHCATRTDLLPLVKSGIVVV